MSVQTYAAAADAKVSHLRTRDGGLHEIDLIVERADQQVVAVKVQPRNAGPLIKRSVIAPGIE